MLKTATSYHNELDCRVLFTANDSLYLNNYTTTKNSTQLLENLEKHSTQLLENLKKHISTFMFLRSKLLEKYTHNYVRNLISLHID